MIFSYFDTSVLLAILLDEDKKEEAYKYWQNSIKVSSLLLKIETVIGLRRIYETNKHRLEANWLNKKMIILNEYLNEVSYMIVDSNIEQEIQLRKDLSKCRSLDAIHIATALRFKKITNSKEMYYYSFDKAMQKLAKFYSFNTNPI